MTARSERFPDGRGGWRAPAGRYMPSWPSSSAEMPPALTGIGASLKEAREARGISFASAERDTHIPRHHLQALEEERFEALHAPVYVRGFLRSYSQYLGLDSTELLAMLPPDAPAEDERLMPLARLGRPRGPREAARARRDPTARDAAPLTETAGRRAAANPSAGDWESADSGQMHFANEPPAPEGVRGPTPLDPLGRLGWPAGPRATPAPNTVGEAEQEDEFPAPSLVRVTALGDERWEQPLTPRRAPRWRAQRQMAGVVPDELQPLFRARALLAAACAAVAILALLSVVHVLGGGDGDPQVFTQALAADASPVSIRAPQARTIAHGGMPDVRGADVTAALTTLAQSGVVPVIIQQTSGGAAARVTTQLPSPGTDIHPETPVVLILGGSN